MQTLDLTALVPEQRRSEENLDDLAAMAVAVAVARPELTAAQVAGLLRDMHVPISEPDVVAALLAVDLLSPEDRLDFVQVMARRTPAWLRVARRGLATAARTALCFAVALLLLLAVLPRTGWYQTSSMLTGSMAPGIPAGAAILGTPVALDDVRVGQVVSLRSPLPGNPVVTHRVIEVVHEGGRTGLRTKGDANTDPDPYVSYPDGDRVWVVRCVVPGLGSVIRALRGPVVRPLLTLGLPAALAGWALLLLWSPRRAVRRCDVPTS